VLIEVNCETDFVARTNQFQDLVRLLAVQVAGLSPRWVDVDQIPAAELEAKRTELAADPTAAAKPAEIRDKIVDGQLRKWFKDVVLLEQPFRDTEETVRDIVTDAVAKIGENIQVRRFERYALGEDR
jgi:elongation factor Ts